MSASKHFFKDEQECKDFFGRVAKNNDEELSPNFVFEGNSSKKFSFIMDIARIVGYENIGIDVCDYEDEETSYVDKIFVRLNGKQTDDDSGNCVWIVADDIAIDADGSLCIFFD